MQQYHHRQYHHLLNRRHRHHRHRHHLRKERVNQPSQYTYHHLRSLGSRQSRYTFLRLRCLHLRYFLHHHHYHLFHNNNYHHHHNHNHNHNHRCFQKQQCQQYACPRWRGGGAAGHGATPLPAQGLAAAAAGDQSQCIEYLRKSSRTRGRARSGF